MEIPVTVDDSQGYLTRETVDRVVQSWTEIIEANRANAAMTCILVHPTDATYKLEVWRRLLERYTREPVWMGTIAAFGDFWARRASVGLAVAREAGGLIIRLDRPRAALGPDLALVVVGADDADGLRVFDRDGVPVPHRVTARGGQRLVALQPQN